MANYQVDNIEMSIIATVEKAIQSFDLAIAKAEKLNQSMGNLDSGIKKTTSSVKSMSNEFKSLDTGSKGLTNTSKQIESIRKSSLGLSDTIKRGFNMLGVVFGLRAMVGLIRKSISLSAEFGENYNLFYVSMDKSVDKAMEFQKSMNSILGANMSETMRYQGFFKALAESLGIASDSAYKMSENLTKLTYDLASLYNIDFDKMYTKLQSGMVGQTKPLREVGIDVTQQTLQGYLDNMGYDIAIQKLSQAEKVMLRYIAILDQSGIAHGDFAKTVESPANQIRVFTDQVKELYVWIGNTFIGLFGRIMPFINGFIMALKEVFKTIAFLFGFSLSDYEYEGFSGGLSNIEDSMDGIGASADNTGKKIKKMLGLLGFNEINNVKTPEEPSGANAGGGIGGAGIYDDLASKLGEYDNLMSKVNMKATDIRNKILDWLGFQYEINELTGELVNMKWGGFGSMATSAKLLAGILAGLVAIKIGTWLYNTFMWFSNLSTAVNVLASGKSLTELGIKLTSTQSMFTKILVPIKGFIASLGAIATPVFIVIGVLVALVTGIVSAYKNIDWFREKSDTAFEKLGSVVKGLWEYILKPVFDGLVVILKNTYEYGLKPLWRAWERFSAEVGAIVLDLWNGILAPVMQYIIDKFGPHIRNVIEVVAGVFSVQFANIGIILAGFLDNVTIIVQGIKTYFSGIIDYIKGVFTGDWSLAWSGVLKIFEGLFGSIGKVAQNTWDTILKMFSNGGKIFNGITSGIATAFQNIVNTIIRGINNVIAYPFQKVNSMLNSIRSIDLPIIGKPFAGLWGENPVWIPRIPTFKDGGFPDGENGLFYANSTEMVGKFTNGRTAVANNEQIVSGIERGVTNAMSRVLENKSFGGDVTVINQMDGREISRHTYKFGLENEMVRG